MLAGRGGMQQLGGTSEVFSTVGVVGLGYVGLPVALAFADKGADVVGMEASEARIKLLRAGRSYVDDVSDERLQACLGKLRITNDYGDLADCEAIIVAVPTPLTGTGDPDMSYVVGTSERLGRIMRRGTLVALESTVFPGATVELVQPALEEASGLRAGVDFNLAYSPERIDPGNERFGFADIPKLVGGLTPECTRRACALYGMVVAQVVPVSSPMVAEMAKLVENTFRAVNIGLVNEMALLCRRMGISVWEVLDAASTKPFGFMRFDPGPGVGGHCIPVDPVYLAWKARQYYHEARLFHAADAINRYMPEHVVKIVVEALNERGKALRGARVLLLGMAYKAGVGDWRESPALRVMELLVRVGAEVEYNDPRVSVLRQGGVEYRSVELTEERVLAADCVVILTAHPEYDWQWLVERAGLVVDTRGVTRHLKSDRVVLL
ncbi:MAG: nucleotide sugar dehydrogenase [Armatimonadetes bacterium]|nr:nucleotide sugar dehydrogenase [Armatimonadota bacterium]